MMARTAHYLLRIKRRVFRALQVICDPKEVDENTPKR